MGVGAPGDSADSQAEIHCSHLPIKHPPQGHRPGVFLSSREMNQRHFTVTDFRSHGFSPRPFLPRPTLNKMISVGLVDPQALEWSVNLGGRGLGHGTNTGEISWQHDPFISAEHPLG